MDWVSVRKPLTYDEVKNIITKLGISLPEDYCKSIGAINGGALAAATCIIPGIGEIPYSRNLSLIKTTRGNAIDIFQILKSQGKELFPFGSVGNGDYYCFDLKRKDVVLYRHETDEVMRICKTYSELMSLIAKQ